MRSIVNRMYHDIIQPIWHPIEAVLLRVPLVYKITSWYSIFLLLMIGLLATFVMQFTHIWDQNEMRTDLQEKVIEAANHPRKYKPFDEGIFLLIYSHDGIILRGNPPDRFPKNTPPSFDGITEVNQDAHSFLYYDAPIHHQIGVQGYIRGVVPMSFLDRKSNNMFLALLLGGILFVTVATIGGYWIIQRGLKPVRTVTSLAEQISLKRDLSERIENIPQSGDTMYQLASTFNHMLSSLEEASNREKRFNSDISHELRTPIAVIQAESDYARQYVSSLEEAKESFQNIFVQSKGMADMVSQLLEIARLDSLTNIDKVPVPLSEVAQQLASTYARLSQDKGLTFTSHIDPSIVVHGNQILLQQAMANLLDNAFKFAHHSIHFEVSLGDTIHIFVQDDGIGIPPESIPMIWDRLYQVDPSRTSKENKGLGLGLFFVQNVVQLHEGTLEVESTPDVRTVFGFHLPIQSETDTDPETKV